VRSYKASMHMTTKPDPKLLAAMNACAAHARDLLESAKSVQAIGRANIAYHLATLALEELGRRELIGMRSVVTAGEEIPPWMMRAGSDHVKKLFRCFYGFSRLDDFIRQEFFFEMTDAAETIHDRRMTGLYVDEEDLAQRAPSQTISPQQAQTLIDLADVFLTFVESLTPRESISDESLGLRAWLLAAFDDPEKRKWILRKASFDKLKELQDVAAWTRWVKSEVERDEAEMAALADKELRRDPKSLGKGDEDRWKMRARITTYSHSIRPKPLKLWNKAVNWIKLIPVQGALSKKELIVELTLGDNIPAGALWGLGLSMTTRLIVALNLATSGFWWWVIARHTSRYYEEIRDLKTGLGVHMDNPDFQVFTATPALTEVHIQWLTQCFVALPTLSDQDNTQVYERYHSGLTFIALSDVHARFEGQAFGNFCQSLKGMMEITDYHNESEKVDQAFGRFLKEKYPPGLEASEHEKFVGLIKAFEEQRPVTVKMGDVYLIKLLCETFFRDNIVPHVLQERQLLAGQ
jgi:AbiV family abortive infection protein